jgi:WD40 repeat protein
MSWIINSNRGVLVSLVFLLLTISSTAAQDSCLYAFAQIEASSQEESKGRINDIAWIPNSNCLVVASSMGLWLYDVEQPETPVQLVEENIGRVAVSPDGATIAYSIDRQASVYLINAGLEEAVIPTHREAVTEITFSSDGNTLAIADSNIFDDAGFYIDAQVQLWDLDENADIGVVSIDTGVVYQIEFSQENQYILIVGALSGYEEIVIEFRNAATLSLLWNIETLRSVANSNLPPAFLEGPVALSDSTMVIGGLYGYMDIGEFYGLALQVWDTQELNLLDEIILKDVEGISPLVLASDNSTVATRARAGVISIFSLNDASEIREIQSHTEDVWILAFHPEDSRLLATVGADEIDSSVRIWNIDTGEAIAVFAGYE